MSAYDSQASGEAIGGSSVTVSLTTSGVNRAIAGFIGSAASPIRTVASFTYAAVSLGTVRTENTNPNYLRGSLYALANPAIGANNLVGTISGNADALGVGAISATAVDQTTPVRAGSPTNAVADTADPSVTIPSAVGDLVVDGVMLGSSAGTPSLAVGAGQTQRWQQTQVYGAEGMSTEDGAASVVMSWTGTGTGLAFVACGLSLQNVSGGAGEDGDITEASSFGASFSGLAAAQGSITAGVEIEGGTGQITGSLSFQGGASAGNVDRVRIDVDDNAPANVGAGRFTLDFWINVPDDNGLNPNTGPTSGGNYSGTQGHQIVDRDRLNVGRAFLVFLDGGRVGFSMNNVSQSPWTVISTTDIRDGADHHVRVQYDAADGRQEVFIDGVEEVDDTNGPGGDISFPSGAGGAANDPFMVLMAEKHDLADGTRGTLKGHFAIYSERLTTGTTYTVPTQPPDPGEANLELLYYFKELAGASLEDETGNGGTGEIRIGGTPSSPTWGSDSPYAAGSAGMFSAQAAAVAAITAGVGAADAPDRRLAAIGAISAQASAGAMLAALADAVAAIAAGVAAGETWASQAEAAATLAAQGSFGAQFTGATDGADSGAMTAGTQAAADFVAAAEAIAILTASASVGSAVAAIASAMGALVAGTSAGAVFDYLSGNAALLSTGVGVDEVFSVTAAAIGALQATTSAAAIVSARAVTRAQLLEGASFGSAFSAPDGLAGILVPASRRISVGSPFRRTVAVRPRSLH